MLFADSFYFHCMFHTELLYLYFLQYIQSSSKLVQKSSKNSKSWLHLSKIALASLERTQFFFIILRVLYGDFVIMLVSKSHLSNFIKSSLYVIMKEENWKERPYQKKLLLKVLNLTTLLLKHPMSIWLEKKQGQREMSSPTLIFAWCNQIKTLSLPLAFTRSSTS